MSDMTSSTTTTKDELTEIISEELIKKRIIELGKQITDDYNSKEIVVIGILKGAFIFMADLVRHIDCRVKMDFVRLASYGSSCDSSGTVCITKDIELDVNGKDVLVVEDIIDTGHTLKYFSEVLKLHNCKSVKICCLIDKKERREVEIQADYVGFQVEKGFLVGYGLDYAEDYRHLKGIFHLRPGHATKAYEPSDR